MELYVHIPFCVKKCYYCDFLSFPEYGCGADDQHRSLSSMYIDSLCREIDGIREKGFWEEINTCYIGGGTPSVLEPKDMEKLLLCIRRCISASSKGAETDCGEKTEFTIECNPGTVNREKLRIYRYYGINRISFGLQSADNGILSALGRIHTYEEFLDNYRLAKELGFDNINIDLISAVPGQTLENWKDTLEKTVSLAPKHISAYSLIMEEGTPLFEKYRQNPGELNLPDEETEREMYHMTKKILRENGYNRYEISNYAKAGYGCRHNIGYWTGEEYIGTGLGAASYLKLCNAGLKGITLETVKENSEQKKEKTEMIRTKNTEDISEYISTYSNNGLSDDNTSASDKVCRIEEMLGRKDMMSEFFILRLRMSEGFSCREFEALFGEDVFMRFGGILNRYIKEGLLVEEGGRIRFSERGQDLSNVVLCEFV